MGKWEGGEDLGRRRVREAAEEVVGWWRLGLDVDCPIGGC